jgi:hypothetical protein
MSSRLSFRFAAVAAIAAAALASACSDSTTAPVIVPAADLSTALGELQPTSLVGINARLSAAPLPVLDAPVPSSCSYDAASRSFACPNVSVSGITVSRAFTLYDASDNPQPAFDRTTTAAVRLQTSFAGTVATSGTTLVIDQQQDVKVSGLLTGAHVLNGSSLGHVTGTTGTGLAATPIASTIATTISSLALPRESTGPNRFPASGTVSALAETTVGALPKITTNVSITFNGTSKAAVTLTVNGVTTHCTVDLSSETAALCAA